MAIVYGIDTSKPYNYKDVRDAILECFAQAHKDVIEKDVSEFIDGISADEFEKIKKINVTLLINNYFKEIGGDFNNPDRWSIVKVCDRLAEFSKNFRDLDVISKHYHEITSLLDGLK